VDKGKGPKNLLISLKKKRGGRGRKKKKSQQVRKLPGEKICEGLNRFLPKRGEPKGWDLRGGKFRKGEERQPQAKTLHKNKGPKKTRAQESRRRSIRVDAMRDRGHTSAREGKKISVVKRRNRGEKGGITTGQQKGAENRAGLLKRSEASLRGGGPITRKPRRTIG